MHTMPTRINRTSEMKLETKMRRAHYSYGMSMNFNDTRDLWQGMQPFTCKECPGSPSTFSNSDELRDHVLDVHGYDPRGSKFSYIKRHIDWDQHAKDNVYTFKPPAKGYATAVATVFDTNLQACIDTGSGASIIDRSLLPTAHNLYGVIQRTNPVTLRGVCGLQITDEMARVNVKLGGAQGVEVPMKAYLVDNLQAGLIIGLSQLEELDTVIYLRRKLMNIQGKEIAVTYAGGVEANKLSCMHVSVSTPTFVIHKERQGKWAKLAKANKANGASSMSSSKLTNQGQVLMERSNASNAEFITQNYLDQSEALLAAKNSANPPCTESTTCTWMQAMHLHHHL